MHTIKSKNSVMYSQSTIVGTIDETTGKCIKTYISTILNAFNAFLKSPDAVGKTSWEYFVECDYMYLTALNTEIQKYFDTSIFVRMYGGGAGATSNTLICRVHWGAD